MKRYTFNITKRDARTLGYIDDFNEWCRASSESEARAYMRGEYPDSGKYIYEITLTGIHD